MNESQLKINDLRRRQMMMVLFVGVLIGALDIAIVGPAMPAIAEDFNVSTAALSWVLSIFVLFNLISAPISARCSDRYGRRDVYIVSLALFATGSLLVAVAPRFEILLFGRIVQAIGAGGIFPVASAVIADVYPLARRGRALGAIGAVFGVAFLLGPLVGGLLLPLGWPVLFLINIPIGIVLMVASFYLLPTAKRSVTSPFDFAGAALLSLSLLAIAYAIQSVGEEISLSESARLSSLLILGLGVVALVAFIWIERRAADPIFPPALLASSQLRKIAFISLVTGIVEAAMVFLPGVAVVQFSVSASQASYMLIPLVLGLLFAAPLAGRAVDRIGVRPVIQLGLVLLVIGIAVFAFAELSKLHFYFAGMLIGAGLASLLGAPLRYAALAAVGESNRGLSQGMLSLSLGVGQIVGAALLGVLMATALTLPGGFQSAALGIVIVVIAGLIVSTQLNHSPLNKR